jgi:hypothetical protein
MKGREPDGTRRGTKSAQRFQVLVDKTREKTGFVEQYMTGRQPDGDRVQKRGRRHDQLLRCSGKSERVETSNDVGMEQCVGVGDITVNAELVAVEGRIIDADGSGG